MSESSSQSQNQHFRTDHLQASIGGRTARGGLVTMVAHGFKFAVSIIATAILARLLSPQDYGLIGMVGVATQFVAMFKDMGLSLATIQKSEINYDQISTLFWVNVSISTAIMVLMMLVAPAVSWFFGEPRLTNIAIVTALGFLIGGLAVQHEALLRRQMRFFVLSAITFISIVAGYAVGIVMARAGFHYWALVFSQLTLLATNTVCVWVACRWRPGRPKRNSGVKAMLKFGGDVTGYSVINYFSRNTDNLLIGRFGGAQSLGLYNKAIQLLGLPTDQINEPLFSVAIPALSRLKDSPERYREAYLRIMEKVIMLTMPVVALMLVASDWLVLLVLGPQWVEAAPILVFMCMAGIFNPVMNTGGWLLVTQGRTREMLYWSAINAPLAIIPIIIGLRWGPAGVAASYSIARLLVANPLQFWFIGRKGPVKTADFYKLLAPFVCAVGVAMLACLLFRKFTVINSALVGFVASAIIIGAVTLLVLCLLPRGRSALLDLKTSLRLLRPVESTPAQAHE
ncbi:MAG TPA: lipopolysaccharide biosynthesis protein [Pyrinomonadaceae bacterium]|jgi:PST family polysaccharide transporter|nr:lipopolysaccharide biosynthesis protein [Pyrinomonadaceae bacterium]